MEKVIQLSEVDQLLDLLVYKNKSYQGLRKYVSDLPASKKEEFLTGEYSPSIESIEKHTMALLIKRLQNFKYLISLFLHDPDKHYILKQFWDLFVDASEIILMNKEDQTKIVEDRFEFRSPDDKSFFLEKMAEASLLQKPEGFFATLKAWANDKNLRALFPGIIAGYIVGNGWMSTIGHALSPSLLAFISQTLPISKAASFVGVSVKELMLGLVSPETYISAWNNYLKDAPSIVQSAIRNYGGPLLLKAGIICSWVLVAEGIANCFEIHDFLEKAENSVEGLTAELAAIKQRLDKACELSNDPTSDTFSNNITSILEEVCIIKKELAKILEKINTLIQETENRAKRAKVIGTASALAAGALCLIPLFSSFTNVWKIGAGVAAAAAGITSITSFYFVNRLSQLRGKLDKLKKEAQGLQIQADELSKTLGIYIADITPSSKRIIESLSKASTLRA